MKRILLSLIVAFTALLGISAQNTYNMVIEMTNGTKINIGPNDVQNIYFTDGELTVSGESIDDLKKDIEDIKSKIAELNVSDILSMINVLQMQIKALSDEIAALKDQGGNDDNNYEKSIIGTWGLTHVYEKWDQSNQTRASDSGESDKDVKQYDYNYRELTFKSDGTVVEEHWVWDGTTEKSTTTYKISGNTISIPGSEFIIKITKLTKDSLLLELTNSETLRRDTYKRIK